MAKIEKVLKDLEKAKSLLDEAGDFLVEQLPSSSLLYRFSSELSIAAEALETLTQEIESSYLKAQEEEALRLDVLDQQKGPIYDALSSDQKLKLAEYLVQQKAPLAQDSDLLEFLMKGLRNATTEEISKKLTKEYIVGLGKRVAQEGADEFDAYAEGLKEIQKILDTPEDKDEFLALLAKQYLKTLPLKVLKEFYNKAGL